jgi:hypothetical protein
MFEQACLNSLMDIPSNYHDASGLALDAPFQNFQEHVDCPPTYDMSNGINMLDDSFSFFPEPQSLLDTNSIFPSTLDDSQPTINTTSTMSCQSHQLSPSQWLEAGREDTNSAFKAEDDYDQAYEIAIELMPSPASFPEPCAATSIRLSRSQERRQTKSKPTFSAAAIGKKHVSCSPFRALIHTTNSWTDVQNFYQQLSNFEWNELCC